MFARNATPAPTRAALEQSAVPAPQERFLQPQAQHSAQPAEEELTPRQDHQLAAPASQERTPQTLRVEAVQTVYQVITQNHCQHRALTVPQEHTKISLLHLPATLVQRVNHYYGQAMSLQYSVMIAHLVNMLTRQERLHVQNVLLENIHLLLLRSLVTIVT